MKRPNVIMGDFNATPSTMESYGELFDLGWTDLGEKAHWWGKKTNLPTCWSRSGAKPSRIDGIITCPKATVLVNDFDVKKNEKSRRMPLSKFP